MTRKSASLDEQMMAELEEIEASYQVPEGAFTFDQLRKKFPNIPEGRLREQVQQKVRDGKMKKARRGQDTYFWPSK